MVIISYHYKQDTKLMITDQKGMIIPAGLGSGRRRADLWVAGITHRLCLRQAAEMALRSL